MSGFNTWIKRASPQPFPSEVFIDTCFSMGLIPDRSRWISSAPFSSKFDHRQCFAGRDCYAFQLLNMSPGPRSSFKDRNGGDTALSLSLIRIAAVTARSPWAVRLLAGGFMMFLTLALTPCCDAVPGAHPHSRSTAQGQANPKAAPASQRARGPADPCGHSQCSPHQATKLLAQAFPAGPGLHVGAPAALPGLASASTGLQTLPRRPDHPPSPSTLPLYLRTQRLLI